MSADEPLVRLTTERLLLAIPPTAHADRYLAYLERNREHMAPWSPARMALLRDVPTVSQRLADDRRDALAGTALRWRLYLKDAPEGDVVGTVSITRIEYGALERANLGFAVDLAHQGRGLVQEAAEAALDHAANALKLRFMEAGHAPQNLRSSATLRRLGFVPFGYARDYLHVGGRVQDHVLLQYDLRPRRRAEEAP